MSIELEQEWKAPRNDRRVADHWSRAKAVRSLNEWEQYQSKKNFIETEYGHRPSNNGLDLMNPAFAFTTNLAKFIRRATLPGGRKDG